MKVGEHECCVMWSPMCAILTHAIFWARLELRQATVEYYTKFYRVNDNYFFIPT
jgi:hypothetical protein